MAVTHLVANGFTPSTLQSAYNGATTVPQILLNATPNPLAVRVAGANISLAADETLKLRYDTNISRWREIKEP